MGFENYRYQWHRFSSAVQVSWIDSDGFSHSASGKSIDASTYGLLIETTSSVPKDAPLSIRIADTEIATTATLRNSCAFGLSLWNLLEFDATLLRQHIPTLDEALLGSDSEHVTQYRPLTFLRKVLGAAAHIFCFARCHDYTWRRDASGEIIPVCRRCDRQA